MFLNILLLTLSQIVASTSVIAIKMSAIDSILLASLRVLVAAILLIPLYLRDSRRAGRNWKTMVSEALPSVLPGLVMAFHFITWNMGARMTLAANASLIVNMMPVAMPFIMYGLNRTLISRREIIGTLVAIAGVMALTGPNLRMGSETLVGDLMCFLAMILLSLYLALAAKNNRQSSVWLYVVPLYWVAGITALAVFLATTLLAGNNGTGALPASAASFSLLKEGLLAVYLAVFPTIVGHTIFNRSMRVLPSQLVSIAILSQFIFAGLIAYLVFGEVPELLWYPAALLVIAGAVVVITGKKNRNNSEIDV